MGTGVFIIILLGFAGAVIAGVVWGFRTALKALPPQGSAGEFAATRRFLALNLCEVPINIIAIPLLAFILRVEPLRGDPLYTGLSYTWPMAVLLVPAFGLLFRDALYRKLSRKIFLLGLGRWAINIVVFGSMGARSDVAVIAMITFVIGCVLFGAHLGWQIDRLDINDPDLCLRLFKSNRDAGLILFAALIGDAVYKTFL